MDLCDIYVGGKYTLNVNEYTKMDFSAADWMSQFADEHGEVPVVASEIDEGDMLDVLIFPSYDDLPIIPNKSDQLWWVSSECLRKMCTEFHISDDLDSLFKDM